ncbi:MAG: 5'-nucleotidase/UDP-sugar diphosphatase [Myxococcota bacterium]|jgi:5'-nucleotidase/UDP-sugar diphosphatase
MALGLCLFLMTSCAEQYENPILENQDIRVTFLHTSDIHSRLIPYDMTVLASDRNLGLLQSNEPFGGIARLAHVIQRERARSDRVAYVDSGDCFQGAPIFNVFDGEIEQIVMSQLRPDAVVIGNHEFDEGLWNYYDKLKRFATYPVLAANYYFEDDNPLRDIAKPYHIANIGGLKIAFIGIANFSSITSITDVGNSLKLRPLENIQTMQDYLDFLNPMVDLMVGISHAGLGEDEEIIQKTVGFDAILGGHLHVALQPPKVIKDKTGREVILAHSGAFAKYVGKLDVVVRNGEIINHKYTLYPIDSRLPEDPAMVTVLEPYLLELQRQIDLTSVFGYASKIIRRFGFGGGDAPLGNLVSEAMRFQARSDFAMTNTLGIRANISEGPITLDGIYNVFPFNNTVTNMFVSGSDVQDLFDYVARRSAGRGCATQVQVAGIQVTLNCNAPSDACPNCPRAENIALTNCSSASLTDKTGCELEPIQSDAIYEMSTNDYIAGGGSGFTVLKNNNTQFNTGLQMRDAVVEAFVRSPKCITECTDAEGRIELATCSTYNGCFDNLNKFHDRFCARLDSTDLSMEVSNYCGHDDQVCSVSEDCLKVSEVCADGACDSCTLSAQCDTTKCAGGVCRCVEGLCVSDSMRCLNGRCANKCVANADCANNNVGADGPELQLCVDGGCVPLPALPCIDNTQCNPALLYCFGGGARCDIDDDCAVGEACEDRRCIPKRTECLIDSMCEAGQECRFGYCRAPVACDANCAGDCINGTCQTQCSACGDDDDCPGDMACNRDLCVPVLSECSEFRCRNVCSADADCPTANVCTDGKCLPSACSEPRDSFTRCQMRNASLNSERCTILPCPRAEADGRIQNILPANLEELPDDLNPDDIE